MPPLFFTKCQVNTRPKQTGFLVSSIIQALAAYGACVILFDISHDKLYSIVAQLQRDYPSRIHG